MANEISRPWTGTSPGDAGAYSSTNWQDAWKYMIGVGGARANEGVFLGSGTQPFDGLRVTGHTPANTQIDIGIGSALVQGIFYLNSATQNFTIAGNASGNARIDTVILRADYVAQTVRLAVLQGSPAASPTPLALTQVAGVTWEIPIADVAVANGFTTITTANITPRQEWINAAAGVYLDSILNNSGGTLVTGDVVVWDTSTDRAVTTTTTQDSALIAGVWVGRTSNGGYGRVLKSGIGYVNANAAVTRGQLLATSTTAKQAFPATLQVNKLAMALETTSGSGLVLCLVDVQFAGDAYVLIEDQKTSGTAGGAITNGAWRTRTLNTEVYDTHNVASLATSQVTLLPGTYRFLASAPISGPSATTTHQTRLQNVTDGTTIQVGTSEQALNNGVTRSWCSGRFTIGAGKALELQQQVSASQSGNGQGVAAGFGTEVYARIEFWRVL